jgi:hypothetical protein
MTYLKDDDGWRYWHCDAKGRMPLSVPKGRVLAHNDIRHTSTMPTGHNGFRAWAVPLEKMSKGFVPCPCGWSGLPHYACEGHVKVVKTLKTADKCWTAEDCGL